MQPEGPPDTQSRCHQQSRRAASAIARAPPTARHSVHTSASTGRSTAAAPGSLSRPSHSMKQAKLPCRLAPCLLHREKSTTTSNPHSPKAAHLAGTHGARLLADAFQYKLPQQQTGLLTCCCSPQSTTLLLQCGADERKAAASQEVAEQTAAATHLSGQQPHPSQPHMHSTLRASMLHTPRASAAHARSHQMRWRHTGRKPNRYTPAQAAEAACRGQLTHKPTCSTRHTHGRSHSIDHNCAQLQMTAHARSMPRPQPCEQNTTLAVGRPAWLPLPLLLPPPPYG